jgi:hypothetical protein
VKRPAGRGLLQMGGGAAKLAHNNSRYRKLVERARRQVNIGLSMRSEDELRRIFDQNCDPSNGTLTKANFARLFPSIAANDFAVGGVPESSSGLDFQSFVRLAQTESPFLSWIASLPICKVYADAITFASSDFDRDPLRTISKMTNEEINAACDGCLDMIKGILAEEVHKLRAAYVHVDEKQKSQNLSASKFEIFTMSCGSVGDFHKGLVGRIGSSCHSSFRAPPLFLLTCFCFLKVCPIYNSVWPWKQSTAAKSGQHLNSPLEITISRPHLLRSGLLL